MDLSPKVPQDPYLDAQRQQAQNDLAKSLSTQTQGDMSNLMARYGTQLAIAGYSGGSPLSARTSSLTGGLTAPSGAR